MNTREYMKREKENDSETVTEGNHKRSGEKQREAKKMKAENNHVKKREESVTLHADPTQTLHGVKHGIPQFITEKPSFRGEKMSGT